MTHKEFFEGELGWVLDLQVTVPCYMVYVPPSMGGAHWKIYEEDAKHLRETPLEDIPLELASLPSGAWWYATVGAIFRKRLELNF